MMKRTLIITATISLVLFAGCRKSETAQPQGASATTPAASTTAAATAAAPAAPGEGTDVGTTMPAYSAPLLDGTTFDITKERGNVVLLNIWATWCGPCRYEIPELEKLHAAHGAQKFKVVGVSIDDGSDAEQVVRQFVAENKVQYPVALDPEAKLANMFQTSSIPVSILIDRNGKIVWKKPMMVEPNEPELMKALETALKS